MNNQKKYSILPALLSILALFCSVTVWADMYKYIDDKGNVSITDDLSNVPEKYRADVKTIKEEKVQVVAQPPTLTQPSENVAAQEVSQPENKQPAAVINRITEGRLKYFAENKKMLAVAIVSVVVLLFAVIFVLNKYVKNRMVTRVVFLLIMALVMTVLYKMYAENVYKQFSGAKKSTEDAKRLLEQKQKEQMKEIDAIGK